MTRQSRPVAAELKSNSLKKQTTDQIYINRSLAEAMTYKEFLVI